MSDAPDDTGPAWRTLGGRMAATLTRPFATLVSEHELRHRISGVLGETYGGDRKLYDVLGYDKAIEPRDYWAKYLRQDIARQVVDAPATTSWRRPPTIVDDPESDTETAFEQAVEELQTDLRLYHYWERVDRLAGIGRYGILFLGFADGAASLADPVEDGALSDLDDLAYLSTFSEARVDIAEVEDDPQDERFGLPTLYEVEFEANERTVKVHWTRVIHVAEDLLENEIYGRPRMEAVYNRLEDLEKVVGGAAEMTWRGADRKYILNADPEMGKITDADALKDEFEDMLHGLESAAHLRGIEVEALDGDVVDPGGLVEVIAKLIAGETGIPQRILTGSERGELASTQDRATWLGRIAERQLQFNEPVIARATLDRLIDKGVLPPPGDGDYEVEWEELFELSEVEEAEVTAQKAKAVKDAAPMGDTSQLAAVEELREQVFGWEPERGSETSVEPEEDDADGLAPEDALDELFGDVANLPAAQPPGQPGDQPAEEGAD